MFGGCPAGVVLMHRTLRHLTYGHRHGVYLPTYLAYLRVSTCALVQYVSTGNM